MSTGSKVSYDGRMVDKANFRAFVYGRDNQLKLVDSWEEFEDAIASGEWFESKHIDEVHTTKAIEEVEEKPKKDKKDKKAY